MTELNPIEWAVLPLKKYARFRGRAPRAEYWWFYLATVIANFLLSRVDKLLDDGDALSSVASLVILVPWLAVTVRRLHDTNRSGWWILILLLAVGASIGLATFAFVRLDNASASASFAVGIFLILAILVAFGTMLVFMVLPGTPGPNRYGSDPYGPSDLESVFA